MPREDSFDNLFRNGLRGCQKQKYTTALLLFLMGSGSGTKLNPAVFLSVRGMRQRSHRCPVSLDQEPKRADIVYFRHMQLLPRLVTPKSAHTFNSFGRRSVRISPDRIPIHVHNGKIKEHVDGPRLAGLE
jgi:hypothetical protein